MHLSDEPIFEAFPLTFFALLPGCFSGHFCPVWRHFIARSMLSLMTVQSYDFFLRYASIYSVLRAISDLSFLESEIRTDKKNK